MSMSSPEKPKLKAMIKLPRYMLVGVGWKRLGIGRRPENLLVTLESKIFLENSRKNNGIEKLMLKSSAWMHHQKID